MKKLYRDLNLNLNEIKKLEFSSSLNKFKCESRSNVYNHTYPKKENYHLNLCENTDSFYNKKVIDYIDEFYHNSFKIASKNVNNDKFYKQSLNRFLFTKIPKLNKLPKLKRIEINNENKINNDYSFPNNFKERTFYDDSLITQNYNLIQCLGDIMINKPCFNKLPEIEYEKRYELSLDKTDFSYLKEINLKEIGKKRQEYITIIRETASNSFNPRKRTSRELELSPENLKKAKIQIEEFSCKEQVPCSDINKIRDKL